MNNNLAMESFPDPSNLDEVSDTSNFGGTISECPSMLVFRLSNDIRQRMIETFDKNHGKNWYHLAAMMKLDQFQTYFATKHSPTEHLLNLWEARHRDRHSIKQLIDILKSLAQYEIATLLERELSDWIWPFNFLFWKLPSKKPIKVTQKSTRPDFDARINTVFWLKSESYWLISFNRGQNEQPKSTFNKFAFSSVFLFYSFLK